MKRFVFLIAIVFLFFSCATNNNVTPPKTEDITTTPVEKINPLAPQILEMSFAKTFGQTAPIHRIKSGESAILLLKLKDSEWNLSKVTIVAEKDGKKESPLVIELDYQYEEEFVFAQGLDSPKEKGLWTFSATAYDHRGLKSKTMTADIDVY